MNLAKNISLACAALAVCAAVSASQAGTAPVVTSASGVCNSTFMQFVDTPASVAYSATGSYSVPLPVSALNVGNCRHFYFLIGTTAATEVDVNMGKMSGATFSHVVYSAAPALPVQSLEVKGPEISVVLHGKPNTKENVQMWFYLTN